MRYITIIAIILLVTFFSCSRKKYKIEIVPDLEPCCYKTNSYWVYLDLVNDDIDTVTVVGDDHYYTEEYITDYTTNRIEKYTYRTQNSSTAETQDFIVSNQHVWEKNTQNLVIYMDYYDLGLNLPECNNYERLDTVFIYDRDYYRVVRVSIPQDCSELINYNIFYTNAEYGILCHDICSDTVLISSKVLIKAKIKR